MDNLGKITGDTDAGKLWIKGQGFQPWYQISFEKNPDSYGEPKPIPGNLSDPFVETVGDNLQLFVLPDDCISLGERLESIRCKGYPEGTPEEKLRASQEGFRRSPDKRLFQPPLVLVNNGFTKFSFADFPVFYQHSLTGISSAPNDEDLLRFFTIFAKSKLALYFLFHTASSWGVERDRVLVHELMRLPFPLPDSSHSIPMAKSIVKHVASLMRKLQLEVAGMYALAKEEENFKLQAETLEQKRRGMINQLQADLDPLIYQYFDLTDEEIILVEDTWKVYEPSSTPPTPNSPIPTLQKTVIEDRVAYSSLLCKTLNDWSRMDQPDGRDSPFSIYAESSSLPMAGMVLVTLKKSPKEKPCSDILANSEIENAVVKISRASKKEKVGFEYLRGIIFGDGEKIHLLKPDLLGQWTRTCALNDADTVFQIIVQSKRKAK
ncbi:MAG: hypothetical protein AB7P49_20655 [Bdellovibrionales bacterium]